METDLKGEDAKLEHECNKFKIPKSKQTGGCSLKTRMIVGLLASIVAMVGMYQGYQHWPWGKSMLSVSTHSVLSESKSTFPNTEPVEPMVTSPTRTEVEEEP